jgi:hypothetical protein
VGIIFGYQWKTPSSARKRIEAHKAELKPDTIADYIFSLAGEFCALWNPSQSQFEFYKLGESALAHFWATLIALMAARQGITSPGLEQLQEALDTELSPILTPVVIN